MGLAGFKLLHPGMESLLKSSGVRAFVTEKAGPVLAAAKADSHDDTGAYEANLHIEQDTTDRAVVRIVSNMPYAYILEAEYGILARALDAAG